MSKYTIGSKEWRLYSGKSRVASGGLQMNSAVNVDVPFVRTTFNYGGKNSGGMLNKTIESKTNNTMPLVIASVLAYLIFA